MRSLNRNKQKMYYSTYSNSIPVYETDENGNIIYIDINGQQVPIETGDFTKGYSLPVEFKENISSAKGETENEVFGVNLDYTKTISTTDLTLPISETSKIWKETEPVIKADGTVDIDSADYSVVAIGTSLNSVLYAVKKLPRNG
jgi:hypothetical protein